MTDQVVDSPVDSTPTGTSESGTSESGTAESGTAESGAKAPNLAFALILISVAQLMVVLDATVANIALPFIGADLDISQANLSWIVTGYSLAFGGLLLLGGRLGDLFGRRRLFTIGLVVFALASLLGGVAQSETMMLASRGLQGVGAAMSAPAALALITTTFPAGPLRNRAFAVYAAMSGFGAAVGLILGGWLTGLDGVAGLSFPGWRLTFLINVPIGLVAAALAPRFLKESEAQHGRMDFPGAITATLGLLGVVFGLTRAGNPEHGWGDTWTIASLVAGVALLAAFAYVESRTDTPLLPLRILQNKNRAVSFVAMMIVPAAMFAMFYFLSQYIQNLMGYSPLKAGLAFLPFSFGIVIGAGLASNLINKIAPRFLAGSGTLLAAVALFGMSRISVDDSPSAVMNALANGTTVAADLNYWSAIFPFIVMMSIGMGMVFVPLTLTAVHHVSSEDSGIGSGVLNTMQQVGGAVGLALLSTVSLHYINNRVDAVGSELGARKLLPPQLDPYLQATFTEGATHAFLVGSGLALLASALIWVFLTVKPDELATDGPEGAPVHVG